MKSLLVLYNALKFHLTLRGLLNVIVIFISSTCKNSEMIDESISLMILFPYKYIILYT